MRFSECSLCWKSPCKEPLPVPNNVNVYSCEECREKYGEENIESLIRQAQQEC